LQDESCLASELTILLSLCDRETAWNPGDGLIWTQGNLRPCSCGNAILGVLVRQTSSSHEFEGMGNRLVRASGKVSLNSRCRAEGLLVLLTLLAGCSRPDEQMRSRVRGNLHKIEDFLWQEMSRLNAGTRDHPPGHSLPPEIGRHAKGAFITPTPPRDGLEKLVTLPDGLVHEQYDVLADHVGFEQWGACWWTLAGCLGATYWRPQWIEIRGFSPSAPGRAVECLSLRIGWQGLDSKPYNPLGNPLTFAKEAPIRMVTTEDSCPSSSWQGELKP
jgi:hypothetical protein